MEKQTSKSLIFPQLFNISGLFFKLICFKKAFVAICSDTLDPKAVAEALDVDLLKLNQKERKC